MATTSILTLRIDDALKRQAESVCQEMGLTISDAITIFLKRMVRSCAIPFEVNAGDPFYSEENLRHLRAAAKRMDAGRMKTRRH